MGASFNGGGGFPESLSNYNLSNESISSEDSIDSMLDKSLQTQSKKVRYLLKEME